MSLRECVLRRVEAMMDRRKPDFIVYGGDEPYMERWWVIPRNRFFNVYAHRFLHDDEDRALHDHPWVSVTWLLKGTYLEHFPDGSHWRPTGCLVARRAKQAHRIELARDDDGRPRQAVSLFFTGPVVRTWGFHCPNGWVPWRRFVDDRDNGKVGAGCGS